MELAFIKTSEELETIYTNDCREPDLFQMLLNKQFSIDEMIETQNESHQKKLNKCKCAKTKCINGYCPCFTSDKFCGLECDCQDCDNKMRIQQSREVQLNQIGENSNKKNKKKQKRRQKKGCNCKKTGCQKKYCECYSKGQNCNAECKCLGCINQDIFPNKPKQKNHPK